METIVMQNKYKSQLEVTKLQNSKNEEKHDSYQRLRSVRSHVCPSRYVGTFQGFSLLLGIAHYPDELMEVGHQN